MSQFTKVEIQKTVTGEFDVFSDGALTHRIFNCIFESDSPDRNEYGILTISSGKKERVGTSFAAKGLVTMMIKGGIA